MAKKRVKKLPEKSLPNIKKEDIIKPKKKNLISVIILLSLLILGLILVLLVRLDLIKNPFYIINRSSQEFVIKDECTLVVGQLIHTIEQEETCELRCKSNCDIRELEYVSHTFTSIDRDCNSCNCVCK